MSPVRDRPFIHPTPPGKTTVLPRARRYPDLEDVVTVTLVEASDHILGTFDRRLVDYVSNLFKQRNIRVLTGTSVDRVEKNVAFLKVGPAWFG